MILFKCCVATVTATITRRKIVVVVFGSFRPCCCWCCCNETRHGTVDPKLNARTLWVTRVRGRNSWCLYSSRPATLRRSSAFSVSHISPIASRHEASRANTHTHTHTHKHTQRERERETDRVCVLPSIPPTLPFCFRPFLCCVSVSDYDTKVPTNQHSHKPTFGPLHPITNTSHAIPTVPQCQSTTPSLLPGLLSTRLSVTRRDT